MNNEIKIQVPEGFEGIDMEKSDLTKGIIVFKKKDSTPWRSRENKIFGYYTVGVSIHTANGQNTVEAMADLFATEKQSRSSQAMAQLSHIIKNDDRFGGPITDEEWNNPHIRKYVIMRKENDIGTDWWNTYYHFLAFHTSEQRNLFMEENMDLIRQYFMLD
jgi:hypothetical protein